MNNLRIAALATTVAVVVNALWVPAVLLSAKLAPQWYLRTILPIASGVDIAQGAVVIVTMIIFAVWIYMAGRNIAAAGFEDLDFTPASRIWWFVVPIAALFKPYQGMRELWNASHGSTAYSEGHWLLGTWWALWIIDTGVSYAARNLEATGLAISAGIGLALAWAALLLVWTITRAQERFGEETLAEVFA